MQPTPANEVVLKLRREKARLAARFPLRSMAVFGSTARGEAGASSDVDVLVDVDPSIGLRFVELAQELEVLLGCPVDLVSRRALTGRMLEQIEAEKIDV